MLSAANGCLDCVVFLTETVKVDINSANQSGNTALHWASLTGQSECVDYLITKGADVLKENIFCKTPFDEAVARDHKVCCEILVKEEVRLNRLAEGLSPLASDDDFMVMEPIESIAEEDE
jgi:ankyrin repeat protein